PPQIDPAAAQQQFGQSPQQQQFGQPYGAGVPPVAPVSANPISAHPASPATPPGVPDSPFVSTSAPPANTPVSASPTSGQPWGVPQFTPRKRKGPPNWLYVVGAIVVVVALAVGAMFWFGPLGGGEPDPQPTGDGKAEHKPELITDDTTK